MRVSYYPGCSLDTTARDYAASIESICPALGIALEEIPDWSCCGASAAHSLDPIAGIELAGRNLVLADRAGHDNLLVPCPLCFNRLKTAAAALQEKGDQPYEINVPERIPAIWDLADFFTTERVREQVARAVKTPLKGLKVVCYYGCMASRPPHVTEAADFENPQSIDRIMTTLGATVLDWPFKTDCCGASQAFSRKDIVIRLVGRLFEMAHRLRADAIVVSCQMCQANLDLYQKEVAAQWGLPFRFPIYYFSELIGVAINAPGITGWLKRHVSEARTLLYELGLLKAEGGRIG